MKLFEVSNGYIGESHVKVYVIAETPERAIELAAEQYRQKAQKRHIPPYDADYYDPSTFHVEVLCEDTNQEWATEPRDN